LLGLCGSGPPNKNILDRQQWCAMPFLFAFLLLSQQVLPVSAARQKMSLHGGLYDRVTAGIWLQKKMPLSQKDAVNQGWSQLEAECDTRWGYRYRLGKRLTPTLLYNKLGYLIGMQILVNSSAFRLWPDSNLKVDDKNPSEILMVAKEEAGHTLLFKNPSRACGYARRTKGTADRLWVLTGKEKRTGKATYEKIPLNEDGEIPQGYAAGGCAPTGFAFPNSPGMGTHYWRNLRGPKGNRVAAEDMGPMFLLYDKYKKLRAFGFTYVGKEGRVPTVGGVRPSKNARGSWYMKNSEVWEFAQQPLYPYFFPEADNPKCLHNLNTWDASLKDGMITTGTLHVFLSDPWTIECP